MTYSQIKIDGSCDNSFDVIAFGTAQSDHIKRLRLYRQFLRPGFDIFKSNKSAKVNLTSTNLTGKTFTSQT